MTWTGSWGGWAAPLSPAQQTHAEPAPFYASIGRGRHVAFAPCFDVRKLRELAPSLPATYLAMERLFRRRTRPPEWPSPIGCMSASEVEEGERRGVGHGYYDPATQRIALNPSMSVLGLWLNLVHENLHHVVPAATEQEINKILVPRVYREVFGRKLDRREARPWMGHNY